MGDLEIDTAVREGGDGRFQADISADWEIWGPMGGYVAACALRAAGAADGAHARPATFSCHYLGVAAFGPVDLKVETRKQGRTVASHRVEMSQAGRPILDAMVWSVGEVEGLEHDETVPPDVPGPDELASFEERVPGDEPPFPFWNNLDGKPIDFTADWPPAGPLSATWQQWLRFRPTATFDDPWVDAARSVILVDIGGWPSAHRPHAWTQPPFTGPTLDLHVAFHQPTSDEDWLLSDAEAPISAAVCSAGPPGCGHPAEPSMPRAVASASTVASAHRPVESMPGTESAADGEHHLVVSDETFDHLLKMLDAPPPPLAPAPEAMDLAAAAAGIQVNELGVVARLMVEPSQRHRSRGQALLRRAASEAHRRGLRPMLDVATHFGPAVALYERAGWAKVGTVSVSISDTEP